MVVDDASQDRSAELVARESAAEPRIRMVRHEVNRKLGASLKTGFAAARKDVVLYMDADLPFDPDAIGRALQAMKVTRADLIAGYRLDRTAEGLRRTVYSYCYNTLIGLLFGWPHRDINFSFKLIRREVLEAIELKSEGSLIDAELIVKAKNLGFVIQQLGLDYFPRTRGQLDAVVPRRHPQDLPRAHHPLSGDAPPAAPRPAGTLGRIRRAASRSRPTLRPGTLRTLVVTADDVGLHPGMTLGALKAHDEGIVTACSVVATGPALDDAVERLRDRPGLDVGVHLTFVGERPLSPPERVRSLLGPDGAFLPGFRAFAARYALGRIDDADLEAELRRQIERLLAAGLRLVHANSHQHLHVLPRIFEIVLKLAEEYRIPWVRVPCDPAAPLSLRALEIGILNGIGKAARRQAKGEERQDARPHRRHPRRRTADSGTARPHPEGRRDRDRAGLPPGDRR